MMATRIFNRRLDLFWEVVPFVVVWLSTSVCRIARESLLRRLTDYSMRVFLFESSGGWGGDGG